MWILLVILLILAISSIIKFGFWGGILDLAVVAVVVVIGIIIYKRNAKKETDRELKENAERLEREKLEKEREKERKEAELLRKQAEEGREIKMDLDKLRQLSQEGQNNRKNDLEKTVLQYCDPKKIAQDLLIQLETNAANEAKKGGHSASAYYYYKQRDFGIVDYGMYNKINELSEILLEMVKKNVSDNNIKLSFTGFIRSSENYAIMASLIW
jgi:hypothetical protein